MVCIAGDFGVIEDGRPAGDLGGAGDFGDHPPIYFFRSLLRVHADLSGLARKGGAYPGSGRRVLLELRGEGSSSPLMM